MCFFVVINVVTMMTPYYTLMNLINKSCHFQLIVAFGFVCIRLCVCSGHFFMEAKANMMDALRVFSSSL